MAIFVGADEHADRNSKRDNLDQQFTDLSLNGANGRAA
jgi:hypothetical protein